ncbi:MAG: CLC_0170 family protein [Bacillota bacterium]
MEILKMFYQEIKDVYSFNALLIVAAIGIYMIVVDARNLKKKKLKKEEKICKFLGYGYIVGGVGLYVVTKLM